MNSDKVRTYLKDCRHNKKGKKSLQEVVAKDLGISRQYLGMIENGDRDPKALLMNKISSYYKKPSKKLFPDLFLDENCNKSKQNKKTA